MKKLLVVFTLILAFGLAGTSNAAIVDLPDDAGNGYFRDLNTGYVWMDIDNFLGMTYSEIETSLAGTDFHIASYDEIQELFISAPLDFSYSYPSTHITTFNEYYDIMGGSGWSGIPDDPTNSDWFRIIWGMYDSAGSVNQWSCYTTGPGIYNPSNMGWAYSSGYASSYALGAFVVETTSVPIPSASYLLISGIVGLATIRRKLKK